MKKIYEKMPKEEGLKNKKNKKNKKKRKNKKMKRKLLFIYLFL